MSCRRMARLEARPLEGRRLALLRFGGMACNVDSAVPPPRKTFTKSRRPDKWAKEKQLRSVAKPEGLGSPIELARRSAFLARRAMEGGGLLSIEKPYESRIWDLPCMVALMTLKGVPLFGVTLAGLGVSA